MSIISDDCASFLHCIRRQRGKIHDQITVRRVMEKPQPVSKVSGMNCILLHSVRSVL
jgi:hypothetical protein